MSSTAEKQALYLEYVAELEKIRGAGFDVSEEEKTQWCLDYLNGGCHTWIDITDPVSGIAVGFLVIGVSPDCHPDADYFICQTFMKKLARRKHLMEQAVMDFVYRHPGVYCMILISANRNAAGFWKHIFEEKLGYHAVVLREISGAVGPGEMQAAFAPPET